MKSKTKTILIFAAILAAVFLIAFLDGGGVQCAAEEEEEGVRVREREGRKADMGEEGR